ncbi:MAG: hypothetical protein U9N86_17660 [Bacteroidota bacterium]|nr:hypothetical protein [Bacteroidota bacterium]
MTNEQQEQAPYRKTLYDKILESQVETDEDVKVDNTDTTENTDNPEAQENSSVEEPAVHEPDYSWAEVDDEPDVPVKKSHKKKKSKESKEQSGKNNRQKRINIMFIVLFTILFGVIAYLIYVLSTERVEAEEMKVTLEMQKENLTVELNDLYAAYDTLQTNNDSMNILIQDRQDQIRNLLAVRASNAKKIQIYGKQLKSLRGVLKSYIYQVDSLNQANLRLQAENRASRDQIKQATNANKQLESDIKSLEGQVEKASVVKALFVQAEPIDNNGNIARKIKRTEKIRVNFALAENAIARRGLKQIYVRIANPNERIMIKNAANVFTYQKESIPYSAMREIEYEGTEIDISIYYDAGEGEIVSGTYYVDLYMDEELIGTTSFSLK